jgi:hypothetical protein
MEKCFFFRRLGQEGGGEYVIRDANGDMEAKLQEKCRSSALYAPLYICAPLFNFPSSLCQVHALWQKARYKGRKVKVVVTNLVRIEETARKIGKG